MRRTVEILDGDVARADDDLLVKGHFQIRTHRNTAHPLPRTERTDRRVRLIGPLCGSRRQSFANHEIGEWLVIVKVTNIAMPATGDHRERHRSTQRIVTILHDLRIVLQRNHCVTVSGDVEQLHARIEQRQ